VFDLKACLELIVALGAIAAMWARLEHRLTRVEDRVQERYRDKKAVSDRIEKVERWLPHDGPQEIQK
jgi:ribosome-associated translation inhibitor RaiA